MEHSFTIRRARTDDAARIRDIYDYYVHNTAITFDDVTPSVQEFQQRIVSIGDVYPYLVAEQDGVVEGYAFARSISDKAAYRWSVELTVYVELHHRGMGIGVKLYEKLMNLLQHQHVQTAYACITHPNPKSEHMHKAFGFTLLSYWRRSGYKFSEWHDVVWMEKRLGTLPTPMPELIPITQLDETVVKDIIKNEK